MAKDDERNDVNEVKETIAEFILREIESVPHLEALLLVWQSRPKSWTASAVARALFINPDAATRILADLSSRRLILADLETGETFSYEPLPERDALLAAVAEAYRRELILISKMIHSKGSPAVRDFARAFRFRKERE